MTTTTGLPPIPGTPTDPPPKATPDALVDLDEADGAASLAVGIGYRALTRFIEPRATLLAAGTTYYVFLAMFSLIALGYGLTALFGADQLASYITVAISEAFPGLLGDEGIDPAALRSIGQAASIVGLLTMLYAGGGAMVSVSSSIHLIYGAPNDPRNFLLKRVRLLGMLLLIAPLIAFSYASAAFVSSSGTAIMAALGIESSAGRFVATVIAVALAVGANFIVVYLLLGRVGGIRPQRRAHLIGAVFGAVAIQILQIPMALILELSVNKPQYGALTVPIGVLLVLYLNSMTLYLAAALTAGIAEREIPLEELSPTAAEDTDRDEPED